MTNLSPYQTLLNAYPGKIRSNDEDRVKVVTIRDCKNPDDLDHIQERLAEILTRLDSEYLEYLQRAEAQQEAATADDDSESDCDDQSAPEQDVDVPEAFRRRRQEDDTSSSTTDDTQYNVDIEYEPEQVELAELTQYSNPIAVPYPRAYRCPTDYGHYMILSPEDVNNGRTCPHHSGNELRRFPYVFVCPRCATYEQASPHDALQHQETGPPPNVVVDDNIDRSQEIRCPEAGCDGHLHVRLGDRLRSTFFVCHDCREDFDLHGYCPNCDRPPVDGMDAVRSEFRPKAIDSRLTEPLLLDDIESERGTKLPDLREASREDAANNERFYWNLNSVAGGSAAVIRDTFGVADVFTVSNIDTISAVYGYQATVTANRTDLDQQGRLSRTFDSPDREKRVYLTRRSGRAIVLDLDTERLARVVSDGSTDDYEALADDELRRLEEMSPDEISEDDSLRLIPLLHAYQHAFYKAAIEEAGLEEFLGAKMLVRNGALVFAEQRQIGAGGLSQITLNEGGTTLLDVFQRTEEILEECTRDCDDGCLACVFVEDAKCHPFISREVNDFVPANSLLDRQLAAEVIRYEGE